MPKWLQHAKDWWWAISLAVGAIIVWGTLPVRVAKVEAGQERQAEKVSDLELWAKELQGYTRAQQQLQVQQYSNQAYHPDVQGLREWDDTEQCFWCCTEPDRDYCYEHNLWRRCR